MEKSPEELQKEIDTNNTNNCLSITKDDFAEFFTKYEKINGDLTCPLCKNSTWAISSREDSAEHIAIVTLPIPRNFGRGIWAFPIYCNECGYMVSFMANLVSSKIRGS